MGYTHYWSFKVPRGQAKQAERAYQEAIKLCKKTALHWNAVAIGDTRLSGYSAHVGPGSYGGVNINGIDDNSHEDFTLREHLSQNGPGFCKTARKPYDCVVVACLAILKYKLGDWINVSSDGLNADWNAGVWLARSICKRAIKNPITRVQRGQAA